MTARDSERTRSRILKALEAILLDKGFPGVGVNAVARKAGVDKVLIYRYFGSMQGLLAAYREIREQCAVDIGRIFKEAPSGAPHSEVAAAIALAIFHTFRRDRIAREIARWELSESNPLTVSFVRSIEQKQLKVVEEADIRISDDIIMAVTMVISGLIFMVLRKSVQKPILNLDLDDPEVIERIEKNVKMLLRGYFREEGVSE